MVAGAEVLGSVALLVPRFTWLAAAGLVIAVADAAEMHATKIPGGRATIVLLVLIVLRRPALAQPSSSP